MAAPISSSLSKLDMNTSSEFALTDGDIFSSNVQKKPSKFNLPITNHVKNNPFSWQGCAVHTFFCCLCWQTLGSHFLSISRRFLEDFLIISGGWVGDFKGETLNYVPLVASGSPPHDSTTFNLFAPPWSPHPSHLQMQSLPHCLEGSTPFPSSSAQHSKLYSALEGN